MSSPATDMKATDKKALLQQVDRRQGRTPLVLFAVGGLFVLLPIARAILPEQFTEYLPGPGMTQFGLGLLFFYVGALIFERQRLNASHRELLASFDEFLSTIYGDDFREKTQAVQVLIQALSTGDPEVVQKSHAQLVRLTGQDLPPEHLAWHEWFRANRTKWLLQRVQQPGSPK
jgi:hypothetical protein